MTTSAAYRTTTGRKPTFKERVEQEGQCPSCGCIGRDCGKIPDGYRFAGQTLTATLQGGALYRCGNCSLAYRWPGRTKSQQDLFHIQGNPGTWQYSPTERPDWGKTHRVLGQNPHLTTVLDVGCFDGGFLRTLGDSYHRFGVEVHPQAAERAVSHGIEIVASDFAELPSVRKQFDIVVSMDVIEHVIDPLNFLQILAQSTRAGGMLVICTGNSNAMSWRFMGSRYWYCSNPEHLSFINSDWCRYAASQLQLEFTEYGEFAHQKITSSVSHVITQTKQLAANVAFKYTPGLMAAVRRRTTTRHSDRLPRDLRESPPAWTTANDHLFAVFRRKSQS